MVLLSRPMLMRASGLAGTTKVLVSVAAILQPLAADPLESAEQPVPHVSPVPQRSDPHVTTSSSGQFIIHGADRDERAKLAMRIDVIHEDFASLVDRAEKQTDPGAPVAEPAGRPQPIHVWIKPLADPTPRPQITQVEGTNQIIFGITIAGMNASRRPAFGDEILRLLLAERMLRSHSAARIQGDSRLLPPWLFTGLAAAIDHRKRGQPSARFAAIVKSGRLMSVEEMLSTDPATLDAVSREAFTVSACGLVLMLLDQPQGPIRFRRFLAQILAAEESFHVQLVRQFPGLALSKNSLEKWCSIQLATLAQPSVFELSSPAETERQLAEGLVVRYTEPAAKMRRLTNPFSSLFSRGTITPEPQAQTPATGSTSASSTNAAVSLPPQEKAVPITEIDAILRIERRDKVLKSNQSALAQLNLRAFPLHRPVINDYQKVLGLLIKGRTKGIAQKLAGLAAQREDILKVMGHVEDQLNWHEATQRAAPSGTFDEYFRLLDELKARTQKRDDPISRYLDEIEQEYR